MARMTVSHWNRVRGRRTVRTDIAIIGAGLVGLTAALAARRLGRTAVILERNHPGSGASTRNAGFLMRGAAACYADAIADWGRDRARAVWRLTEQNQAELRSLGIASLATFEPRPSCLLALRDGDAARLESSCRLLRDDGFAAEVLTTHTDPLWARAGVQAGLVNPGDSVVNPGELIAHLAAQVGDALRSGEEVFALEDHRGGAVVRTATLDIECRHVLLCTNAFTGTLLERFAGIITPARGQMLALRAPRADHPVSLAYYANDGSEYFRRADHDTVVVGGWRTYNAEAESTLIDGTSKAVQEGLEGFARQLFGRDLPITARWSGPMGFTGDGLPLTGPISETGSQWICAGFHGHGMSLGAPTARLTVEAMVTERSDPPFPVAGRLNPAHA